MKNEDKWWLPSPEVRASWKGTWRDDWRVMGQEGYLLGKRLQHRRFNRALCIEDYDQCEFCWDAFDKDPKNPAMAYFEPEQHLWICEKCYKDFLEHFHWTVEEVGE